ncbi:hypothetical protein CIRG_03415 [Coccidioides immitis RMSCC 2394]|uniref:Uncharacterized protein n=1 Tax=Coccidioides immitis RMSCC 2394 TaxID=404692 RepID=A0A0J6YAC1_COCIT|nr:hypothetical protein CIRG_03415 [Coccidioides immitis RMSCC 2394]
MAEAITEAGAEVHCFDILPEPDDEFVRTQELASKAHIGNLHYHHVDVRDSKHLNDVVEKIALRSNRLDGLVAAAGVQQVTEAIDYTVDDVTKMPGYKLYCVFINVSSHGVAK